MGLLRNDYFRHRHSSILTYGQRSAKFWVGFVGERVRQATILPYFLQHSSAGEDDGASLTGALWERNGSHQPGSINP